MSYTFIQQLQEAANIKFLGNVPRESVAINPDSQKASSTEDPDTLATGEEELDTPMDTDQAPTTQEQDPDKMGDIRVVKGAHLVYKRQRADGTFKELWIYNIGSHINDSIAIKRAILAGTDIKDGKLRSEDGSQTYQLSTLGNAQMLCIDGLSQ